MIRFQNDPVPPLSRAEVNEAVTEAINGTMKAIGYYNGQFTDALFKIMQLGSKATQVDIDAATKVGIDTIWRDE